MPSLLTSAMYGAGMAVLLYTPPAHPQELSAQAVAAQLADLQRQLAEQRRLIDELSRALAARPAASAHELQAMRGTGNGSSTGAPNGARSGGDDSGAGPGAEAQAHAVYAPSKPARPTAAQARGSPATRPDMAAATADSAQSAAQAAAQPAAQSTVQLAAQAAAQARAPARPPAPRSAPGPVGAPPPASSRPPEVAPLFEQAGVLTPRGKLIFEPALQFGYSSSNRVALVGYTIIPALLIGLVDVREVKRNTTTAILGGRYGLTNRLEVEARLPYVYRSDATVSREIFTGTAVENVFSTSGRHQGDAELGLRYQLNRGGPDRAFYVASLRLKSRTGRDPFSVVTDCTRRCIGPNASGTGLPLELPTGSGFYAIQPGVTWLYPSDPAVFFGSVSYLHNVRRKNVSRTVLGGEQEFLGEVAPGHVVGLNFGMGLGLNEKSSFSLGYDHSSIGRTKQGGIPAPGSVRTQLGTLLLGFSYRMSERRSVNVSVGAGLTRDTPDVSLTLRMPTTF